MRLRDISERVREIIEVSPEALFGETTMHALVQDIQDVQTVYRPIASSGRKAQVVPWLSFSFEPFSGLIEPFNIYPGRFWGLQRIHRQPSGLPELVTHVARELPSASEPIEPDLYASFSHSPKVETVLKKAGKDPASLRFFHRGNLMLPDRTTLPAEMCLPGIESALPEGYIEDGIPGIVEMDDERLLYLGELIFYNQYRTPDRAKLRNFLLNCVAVSVVLRYVRDIVRKSMA
ncbi:MAG: hypothetical protein R3F65_18190 [bacterium]